MCKNINPIYSSYEVALLMEPFELALFLPIHFHLAVLIIIIPCVRWHWAIF